MTSSANCTRPRNGRPCGGFRPCRFANHDDDAAAPAVEVAILELPQWCRGIAYRAETNTIELVLTFARSLSMSPVECQALVNGLSLCLKQAAAAAAVVDVEPG